MNDLETGSVSDMLVPHVEDRQVPRAQWVWQVRPWLPSLLPGRRQKQHHSFPSPDFGIRFLIAVSNTHFHGPLKIVHSKSSLVRPSELANPFPQGSKGRLLHLSEQALRTVEAADS